MLFSTKQQQKSLLWPKNCFILSICQNSSRVYNSISKNFLGVDNTFTISKEGSVENRVMIRCTQGYLLCVIINGLTDLSSDNPQLEVQWSFLLVLAWKGSLFCCLTTAIITTHYNYNTTTEQSRGIKISLMEFLSSEFIQFHFVGQASDSDLNSTEVSLSFFLHLFYME